LGLVSVAELFVLVAAAVASDFLVLEREVLPAGLVLASGVDAVFFIISAVP
jgi:hypothetical protein